MTRAAEGLGITRQMLSERVNERTGVSVEMATRLSKALGSTPETWLGMQMAGTSGRPETAPGSSRRSVSWQRDCRDANAARNLEQRGPITGQRSAGPGRSTRRRVAPPDCSRLGPGVARYPTKRERTPRRRGGMQPPKPREGPTPDFVFADHRRPAAATAVG
ncbi:MAG: HigA family addiction module antitoxin [Rhodospirillaceae bacterium]|nr:HigA family addiction module antitoxin [Rhodospirillaceae bacterium]